MKEAGLGPSKDDSSVPLYQQIKQWIRDAVAVGDYDPNTPFTTEKQLRERFGVSTATAVRALNDLVNEGVLVRKRARGTFVADPPPSRRSPDEGGNRSVAYVAYGYGGPHQAGIMQGIGSVCMDLGYRLFVTDTSDALEHEAQAIVQAIESGADGVLWYPHDGTGDPGLLAELQRHDVPVVFIDRYLPSSPTDAVLADNFAVGYQLTTELVMQGHTRIATLWDEWRCTSVRDRLSGHIQALREHDLPVAAELTALRPYHHESTQKRHAYLRDLLDNPAPPTVMMCANGFILATVAHDLVAMGVGVPDEVDVASMDDAGPFNLLPLASVAAHLPSREMGESAMRLLSERITGSRTGGAEHVVLPVGLRARASGDIHLRPVKSQGSQVLG